MMLITTASFAQITNPYGTFTGCRPTSITLDGPPNYSSYLWSTGETTRSIEYVLTGSGGQILDTATVGLTCFDYLLNPYPQTPVVVRSIREPKLLDRFNKVYNYDLTDSIKSELVLTYLTAPKYVFTFIQTDTKRNFQQTIVSTYVSTDRWCRLDQVFPPLVKGKYYYVTIHARVNNVNYCKGNYGEIGIAKGNSSPRISNLDPIDIEVYPNPFKENCNIMIDSDEKTQSNLKIVDILGKVVYDENIDGFPIYENIGQYISTPGVYKVILSQGGKVKSITIEKQ